MLQLFRALLLALACLALAAHADTPPTEAVFDASKQRIVQVRILEKSANTKASLGSGFIVNARGQIVTNYHVVSDLVFHPELYRGEVYYADGQTLPLKLINFDVVNDLAVVETGRRAEDFFQLETGPVAKGTRAYAIGTPHDLGFTIVEGNYNGLLASLYEKVHYTGAINPGMSGGPAILADGRVVGVNVATAGNQIGFLVPAIYVLRLLNRPPLDGKKPLNALRTQLLDNQARIVSGLTRQPLPAANFHGYQVPAQLGSYSKCWADTDQAPSRLYRRFAQQCSTEDDLFLYREHTTGKLQFVHDYLEAPQLNYVRFYLLMQNYFEQPYEDMGGTDEDVGPFSCNTDFVRQNGLDIKVALCVRGYRRLPGLYDMVLKLATLNREHAGLLSQLQVSGISFANARLVARRYLEAFAWRT